MIFLDLMVKDAAWHDLWPDMASQAEQALTVAAGQAMASGLAVELSLVLMDDRGVQSLNRDYRGQDKPTNVLSFPALSPAEAVAARGGGLPPGWPTDQPLALGDIVLALQTVQREAGAQGKPFLNHVRHLLVHGFLHLLGYDHGDDAAAMEMEGLEIAVLKTLDVANPYAAPSGAHHS